MIFLRTFIFFFFNNKILPTNRNIFQEYNMTIYFILKYKFNSEVVSVSLLPLAIDNRFR